MPASGNVSRVEHDRLQHHSHVGRYLVVWGALLVLDRDLPHREDPHRRRARDRGGARDRHRQGRPRRALLHAPVGSARANRLVFVTSLVFVALLIGLTVADYATRFPLANPPGGEGALPAPDYDPPPARTR